MDRWIIGVFLGVIFVGLSICGIFTIAQGDGEKKWVGIPIVTLLVGIALWVGCHFEAPDITYRVYKEDVLQYEFTIDHWDSEWEEVLKHEKITIEQVTNKDNITFDYREE
jgi:hypothetical protein